MNIIERLQIARTEHKLKKNLRNCQKALKVLDDRKRSMR